MKKERKSSSIFKKIFIFFVFIFLISCAGVFSLFLYYSFHLPDVSNLDKYEYNITSRLYSEDGILLKEYADEKRIFVEINKIPKIIKEAFISAEDKNYYKHKGIDFESILSAAIYNVEAYFKKTQFRGGSTITQQVVKNLFLTNERTLARKIKEAILSFKITNIYSKDKILEIYLNHIFLGNNSYGVAAASLSYFNKPLNEINLEEAAVLASLPKAPGKLNPALNKEGAINRRNYVLERMFKDGYITTQIYTETKEKDLILFFRTSDEYYNAGAFTEDTRKKLLTLYDEKKLLKGGLVVTTTIKPNIQTILRNNLESGLELYDMRHGYRGELGNICSENELESECLNNWANKLKSFIIKDEYKKNWKKAVVLKFDIENNEMIIGYINDKKSIESDKLLINDKITTVENKIILKNTKWLVYPEQLCFTNRKLEDESQTQFDLKDFVVTNITDVNLKIGSIIFVDINKQKEYIVKQVPKVNGAAVVLDPHTGRIFGMVGGYFDSEINFNRVTQANRQLGSILKPIVYTAAFENGYDGTDKIMDEEILLPQGAGIPAYKPKNFANIYYGLVSLRKALQSSYNVSAVRLSSQIGLKKTAEVIKRFNINKNPKRVYSMVLGSLESKLIDIVNAYGMLVNGGKFIQRETIEKIQNRNGKTLYKRDKRKCLNCNLKLNGAQLRINDIVVPFIKDERKSVTDEATAYQITYILQGAVKYGTAWTASKIEKIVGGKTGTSNDFKDAWFIGFTPDIILGVYVGFDDNTTLGVNETGSRAASPIFVSSMKEILKNAPSIPFRVPDNIQLKRIDVKTGESPTLISNKNDIIFEAFKIDKKFNKKKKFSEYQVNNYMNEEHIEEVEEDDIFITRDKLQQKIKEEEEKEAREEEMNLKNDINAIIDNSEIQNKNSIEDEFMLDINKFRIDYLE